MRRQRCALCRGVIDAHEPVVYQRDGRPAHMLCDPVQTARSARSRALLAWGEAGLTLLLTIGGVVYWRTGGVLCLAGALVLAWRYPDRHCTYWLRTLYAMRRRWRRWFS